MCSRKVSSKTLYGLTWDGTYGSLVKYGMTDLILDFVFLVVCQIASNIRLSCFHGIKTLLKSTEHQRTGRHESEWTGSTYLAMAFDARVHRCQIVRCVQKHS